MIAGSRASAKAAVPVEKTKSCQLTTVTAWGRELLLEELALFYKIFGQVLQKLDGIFTRRIEDQP